jgi:hypothetical protein
LRGRYAHVALEGALERGFATIWLRGSQQPILAID